MADRELPVSGDWDYLTVAERERLLSTVRGDSVTTEIRHPLVARLVELAMQEGVMRERLRVNHVLRQYARNNGWCGRGGVEEVIRKINKGDA